MIQLLIAILLGLASPIHSKSADQHQVATSTSNVEEEDCCSTGGENGQLPLPPNE